jgi:hypothetical protein
VRQRARVKSAALLALAACTTTPVAATRTAAPAPLLDTSGGTDRADRDCEIVLRQLLPADSDTFVAEVEISAAAASQGLAPALLYQSGTDATWYSATGVAASDGATPGFVKYEIAVDSTTTSNLQAVPYLAMPDGSRVFDHNRNSDDLASYVLDDADDYSIWPAPAVCAAPTDARGATLAFAADFTQSRTGVIVAGGSLALDYDVARLPACRGANWDVTAHVVFQPDGELLAASVAGGSASFTIPTDGAQSIAIWFDNHDDTGCQAWDSAYGANYVYAVERAPQWLGLPTNLLTRDSSSHCAGGSDAASGFSYDTWARQRADITNLCFQVYQPGETDTDDSDLWEQLDVAVYWRLSNGTTTTAWTAASVGFDARVGNNAQYALSWRDVDPFRDYHCPELAPTATSDGMYVQLSIEYYVDVNGGELRPEPGASYGGTFVDYPTNAWRTANCP